jgi:endonuclease/exonuclease/phosphatase family metal-dependent hydrolase
MQTPPTKAHGSPNIYLRTRTGLALVPESLLHRPAAVPASLRSDGNVTAVPAPHLLLPRSDRTLQSQQAKERVQRIPRDERATVVAGDFNASSRNAQHVENVASLRVCGLVNAYDAFYGTPDAYPGDHPTSYHQWNEAQPH